MIEATKTLSYTKNRPVARISSSRGENMRQDFCNSLIVMKNDVSRDYNEKQSNRNNDDDYSDKNNNNNINDNDNNNNNNNNNNDNDRRSSETEADYIKRIGQGPDFRHLINPNFQLELNPEKKLIINTSNSKKPGIKPGFFSRLKKRIYDFFGIIPKVKLKGYGRHREASFSFTDAVAEMVIKCRGPLGFFGLSGEK
jgi:hypothetical protein